MSALLERASRYQIRPMYACDANGVGPSTAFGPESESQRSAGSGGQSYSQTPSSQDGGAHGRDRKSTSHKARGDAASLDTGWQALWMQLLKRVADQDDTIRQMKGDMHELGGTLAKVVTTNTKLHEELATIRSSHATATADVAQVVQDAMRREGQAQEARLQQAVDDMRKLVVDSAASLRRDDAQPSSSPYLVGAGTKSINKKRRASEFAAAPDDALDDDADAAGGELDLHVPGPTLAVDLFDDDDDDDAPLMTPQAANPKPSGTDEATQNSPPSASARGTPMPPGSASSSESR